MNLAYKGVNTLVPNEHRYKSLVPCIDTSHCHSHGVSLHLSPRLPPPLLPVQGVQVAVDVGRGGREDPLGVSLDSLINNIARAVNFLRCDLQ